MRVKHFIPVALSIFSRAQLRFAFMAKTKQNRFKRDRIHLREWRKYRGLTQAAVADRTEIDQSTIARIETGRLPYNEETLARFAVAYGVDVPDLFTNPMEPDPPKLVYQKLRGAPKSVQDRALAIIDALLKAG